MQAPLDRAFNVAVNHIASVLFPTGFDVADTAPSSLSELQQHVAATGRMLVWDGASDATIFGDDETNFAFRAWHDWCHLFGGFTFDLAGETLAMQMQQRHIRTLYGNGAQTDRWCKLLEAEIVGQARYHAATGAFPADQVAFTRQYLAA